MLTEPQFNQLYLDRKLKRMIFSRIAGISRRSGITLEPEDLHQEIFLKVWQERERFIPSEGEDSGYGWVLSTAKNVVFNHLQSEQARLTRDTKWTGVAEFGWDEEGNLEPIAESKETPEVFLGGERTHNEKPDSTESGVERLPKELREVLTLRLEGYTHKEVAEKLGISEALARKRLERAKKKLLQLS